MAYIAIALKLGMLPSVFLRSVSSRELATLLAYHKLSPVDDSRGDLQAGIVASVIANVNRDQKRRPTPFSPVDFMPYERKPKENHAQKFRAQFAHLVKKDS